MIRRTVCAAFCAAVLGASGYSQGTLIKYSVILDGPSESPPNASPGIGSGEVDVDNVANTMHLTMSFSGLLGTTTASHIHAATAVAGVGTAGVATTTPSFAGFPLGVTSGSYDSGLLDLTSASSYNPAYVTANGGTTASAEAALLAAMAGGKSYLNIHTSVVPGGEIRGFLLPVPEPVMAGVLVPGIIVAMRRRSR